MTRSLPVAALVLEELGGDDGTDGVAAAVLRARRAAPVPVEAGQRVAAALLELATQHVALTRRHGHHASRGGCHDVRVTVARSILLFALAAVAEIGGAWLVWQGVREHRGWAWIGAGVVALGLYGFVATLQPDAHFGRILAAYGGVFIAGSLLWGMALDGFRPDRWDVLGALLALAGVAVIMYAPRAT